MYARRVVSLTTWGLAIGGFFALWAMVPALLGGSFTLVLRENELNVFVVAGVYLAGGALAGSTVGLLFPLTRSRIGSAVLGTLALYPLSFGAVLILSSESGWDRSETITVVLGPILLGGVLGPMYRSIFIEEIEAATTKKKRR